MKTKFLLMALLLCFLSVLPAKGDAENGVVELTPIVSMSHELIFDSLSSGYGGMEARWSKDNRRVLSWHSLGGLHIWDAASGESLFEIPPEENKLTLIGWTPDENYVLTVYNPHCASGDCLSSVQVWDTQTNKLLRELPHKKRVNEASLSPDGNYVFTIASDDYYRIWDIASDQELLTLACKGYCFDGIWSPNGEVLATSETGVVKLWNTTSGEVIRSIPTPGMVCKIEWSPNGASFYIQCHQPGCDSNCLYPVNLLSADGQQELWNPTTDTDLPVGIRFYGDTPIAFWEQSGIIHLWNAAKDTAMFTLDQHDDIDDRSLSWDTTAQQFLTHRGTLNHGCCIGKSALWDVTTGNLLFVIDSPAQQAAWSPDGKLIATYDNEHGLLIWDTRTGSKLAEDTAFYKAYDQEYRPGDQGLSWSADGTRLLSWSGMGVISIYDVTWLES